MFAFEKINLMSVELYGFNPMSNVTIECSSLYRTMFIEIIFYQIVIFFELFRCEC